MNLLEQLKKVTVVVADTGDFNQIRQFTPRDATTNPSLILKASSQEEYQPLVDKVLKDHQTQGIDEILDRLSLAFGLEILKLIPGRVSTEVDARLSFNIPGTLEKARKLISLYRQSGIDPQRVLIKVASTWEGIRAAEILEKEGIHCNLTLLFSPVQAAACAEAGVTLISPFVGRIMDWYKVQRKVDSIPPEEDPGVQSVKSIYNYYKKFGYSTEIMGASFRNSGEILELAGCDLLTISPDLLKELSQTEGTLAVKLNKVDAGLSSEVKIPGDESSFRWFLNEDPMATEKLSQGIRTFAQDLDKLRSMITKGMK